MGPHRCTGRVPAWQPSTGQYCSPACRIAARLQQRRRANRRHQQSPEGRQDHRDRQEEYRRRQCQTRVTDRASILDPYLEFIRQTLDQHPRLCATRIYQMVRERGYTGSIIQLRRRHTRHGELAKKRSIPSVHNADISRLRPRGLRIRRQESSPGMV